MILTQTAATETVFTHHLAAFVNNDMHELLQDYTPQSELWTPNGKVVGIEAIADFYNYVFSILPTGSSLSVQQQIIKDEKAYIVWSASSHIVDIPLGTDTFEIREGKIRWQSLAAQIIHKQ